MTFELRIVSTAASRRVLTSPALTGADYRRSVATAATEALRALLGTDAVGQGCDRHWNVLNVLRGGLSFGLDLAVAEAFGREARVSFVGTTRRRSEVVVDYERWALQPDGILAIGEICATGATLAAVLAAARQALDEAATTPAGIVLVLVAARPGLDAAAALVSELWGRDAPPVAVAVLEAVFDLPSDDLLMSRPELGLGPLDFLRGGESSDEFRRARDASPESWFERCAIYDGGQRAFEPADHCAAREGWWRGIIEEIGDQPVSVMAPLTGGDASSLPPSINAEGTVRDYFESFVARPGFG